MNWQELLAALRALGVDIPALPIDLTDPRVTPEQLATFRTELDATFNTLRSGDGGINLANLKLVRDAQTALRGEIDGRVAVESQANADAAALAELEAQAAANDPTPPVVETPAEGTQAEATTVVVGAETAETPEQIELARVAAAQTPAEQVGASGGGGLPQVRFHVASGLGGGASAIGAELEDISQIGPRIMELAPQYQAAIDGGRRMEKVVLASLPPIFMQPGVDQDGIVSMSNTAARNTEIIKTRLADHHARVAAAAASAAGTPTAHTAAAPWCEPFDNVRAIPDCVNTDTPVFNSLPFQPMGYGGFQFNSGVGLADLDGAVDIWKPADQAAIDPTDPATWKRCLALTCPGALPQVTLDDWLTACVEWQVGMELNNPERFADFFSKLEGRRARLKEQYTLALLDVLLKNYKNDAGFSAPTVGVGGLTDLIGALISMFQTSEYNERSNERNGYTLYMDTHILDTLVYAEYGAAYAKSSATRESIKALIVQTVSPIQRVIDVMDRVPGQYGTVQANGNPRAAMPADNAAAVVVPELVNNGRLRVIPTGEVFAFGTGEQRTGVSQDFSYARQNKVGWFAEEAFALTKYGCQPWFALNATVRPAGFYVGLINRSITAETAVSPFTQTYTADNAAANEPDPAP